MDIITITLGHFRMFSLLSFQSKGHNQKLLLLRYISIYITVISDDRRIQIRSSRKARVGLSRYFNNNRTFANFGQPGFQFQCKEHITSYLERNCETQVKSYRLTP